MLSSLFDEYSINARIRPALLAFLPLIVFVYLAFPELYEVGVGLLSILVACGFVTALAHFSRNLGRAAEARLFAYLGGKPTSIMLRHRDSRIDGVTKARYHEFFKHNVLNWIPPSTEEENSDPESSDQVYDSAVKWLLEQTRDTNKYNLLFKENISYGFRRNCYGIKLFGVVLSISPVVAIAVSLLCFDGSLLLDNPALVGASGVFSLVLTAWWLLAVNRSWVTDAAFAYAGRLLAACDSHGRT